MLNGNGITFSKIILAIGSVDLRKGIDGLCSVIRYTYNRDPLEKDTLFLFCGTRRDRLKGVLWSGDRYILLYIRLSEGSFRWPRSETEARTINVGFAKCCIYNFHFIHLIPCDILALHFWK